MWSPTGEELAYVEYSDTLWALYLVRWDEAGPQAPRELLHSDSEISDLLMVTP